MLRVKKLDLNAKIPTVAHAGEDLGYDLFALEDTILPLGESVAVRTGIAARFTHMNALRTFGLIIKDRSSMAAKGIRTSAGVIDSGYTGELKVMMTNTKRHAFYFGRAFGEPNPYIGYEIKAGDKIAQMIPTEVFTGTGVAEVETLETTSRGDGGFGSTGN